MNKFLFILLFAPFAFAHQYHADTAGVYGAVGSLADPWMLVYALDSAQNHGGPIVAGDTIWVHGGMYRGAFVCKLNGTDGVPIIVRNYNNERVTLRPADPLTYGTYNWTWSSESNYCWLWGIEMMCPAKDRYSTHDHDGNYIDIDISSGVTGELSGLVAHYGLKVINCILHDLFSGISAYRNERNFEINGCIFYNIGINSTDPNDGVTGYPIYMNSPDGGWKRAVGSILVNNLDNAIVYYTGTGKLDSMAMRDNIGMHTFLMSGDVGTKQYDTVDNNYLWEGLLRLGQDHRTERSIITNNRVFGPNTYSALSFEGGDSLLTVTGNTLLANWDTWTEPDTPYGILLQDGYYSGSAKYPDNTFVKTYTPGTHPLITNAPPTVGDSTYYIANAYETKRGHIVSYNWDSGDSVVATLSGFSNGDTVKVYNASNFYGDQPFTAVVATSAITVPMTASRWTMAVPESLVTPTNHFPLFGAFVVIVSGNAPPLGDPPVIDTYPSSASVLRDATHVFSITASNMITTYQWQKNSVNIVGATSSSYTATATYPENSGAQYRCIVTNAAGSDTSAQATLSIQLARKWIGK